MADQVTFSFGRNWGDYLKGISEEDTSRAKEDIEHWLGESFVNGRRVLDIGSGSGIHSLCFLSLGAKDVFSFDFDPLSVEATKKLHKSVGSPANWVIEEGSILDRPFVTALGQYDIVYSWGVLHHTGSMWKAIENTFNLVRPGGTLWIALYKKGGRYNSDLALKQKYNRATSFGKRWLEAKRICTVMCMRARKLQNPFAWNQKISRGMNVYNDIVDWLGGLPYETATEDEVIQFSRRYGFILERIKAEGEGGCSVYVFTRAT